MPPVLVVVVSGYLHRVHATLGGVLDRRLLIVSGKGGVGKSAVTAALARLASTDGQSVLAVALTDSSGLGAHLGLQRLDHEPVSAAGRVEAMAVDRVRALDEYLRLQLHLPAAAPLSQVTKLFGVLVDTVPGVREIISMGKPVQDVWAESHDLVVVDAPPLGQLFSYLSAPEAIARLVPSGNVREQASRMRETLCDREQTGLVLVTTLEELPIAETDEALSRAESTGVVDVAAVVANRVLEPLGVAESAVRSLPPGPVGDAARLHHRLAADQARWAEVAAPEVTLPYFFGDIAAPEVAESIAACWTLS